MPHQTLRDQAYHIIYQQIVAGTLARGTVTSEVQLSAQLDMSRTPVRAALQQLETEGFVKIIPKHGVLVLDTSAQRAGDLLELIAAMLLFAIITVRQLDPEGLRERSSTLLEELRATLQSNTSAGSGTALCEFELYALDSIITLSRNQEMQDTLNRSASRLFWQSAGRRWAAPYRIETEAALQSFLLSLPASGEACQAALLHYLHLLKITWN
ncbi:GntR family transcriptional regulator [Paenibacillus sacheonensis]|uniref:GntR family transcriptional regulator n=1 Tax=Paenibacillus sacheonensis TaxID=742054 RepID=A0A7X4YLA8_9BACL|nr:GntR family transcriptional regulator [Paenibacillus sacheonensis]MBM7568349.1 DNA-binding GntR family transcriptional regulator [Paenibacillus sacheonensis]NBC68468.1 GntR family transcriptional regulator [Paenibacillus sacheonensis]